MLILVNVIINLNLLKQNVFKILTKTLNQLNYSVWNA